MKMRKWLFKNHGTSLRVRKVGDRFCFHETHLHWMVSSEKERGQPAKLYSTYEDAVKAMQRYSKRYYGEKAQ